MRSLKISLTVFENQKGFTYVELLAVTVTVMMLGMALLPGLPKAHRKALQARCISNLKRIDEALKLYALAHQDSLPGPVSAIPQGGYDESSRAELSRYLAEFLGYPKPSTNMAVVKELLCPACKLNSSWTASIAQARTYALNENVSKKPGARIPPFGSVSGASSSPLRLSELGTYGSARRLFTMTDADKGTINPVLPNWGDVPYRPSHGKSRNWLFFDGHVEVKSW